MKKTIIELINYGVSTYSTTEGKCALSLAKTIEIASNDKFADIIDVCKIIIDTYGKRTSDGKFYFSPIPEKVFKKILKLEKTAHKRRMRKVINQINK